MLGHCQAYDLQEYGLQAYKTKTKTKREAKIKNEKRTKINEEKKWQKDTLKIHLAIFLKHKSAVNLVF